MDPHQTSCTLHVIGVPIGNVSDLSQRAIETLSSLKFIFCEDRRQTQELFKRAKITTNAQLICLNEHKEHQGEKYLEKFKHSGGCLGFVTDAGTPSISDPGSIVVQQAHRLGIKVVPVPGASALSTFISVIGAPPLPIHFVGFLPKKSQAKKDILAQPPTDDRLLVFFESPHRVRETLEILRDLNVELPIYLAREMTKTYEEILIIDQQMLSDTSCSWLTEKGEFVLAIVQRKTQDRRWCQAALDLSESLSSKSTALFIQKYFDVPKNTVYNFLLEQK